MNSSHLWHEAFPAPIHLLAPANRLAPSAPFHFFRLFLAGPSVRNSFPNCHQGHAAHPNLTAALCQKFVDPGGCGRQQPPALYNISPSPPPVPRPKRLFGQLASHWTRADIDELCCGLHANLFPGQSLTKAGVVSRTRETGEEAERWGTFSTQTTRV
ncbi:hypothetical protein BaRGS_00032833 [Batillaria attramentaria]|uniref:Uncharacterized protein n=1 Tax=Batillaria attramentaria TaxID=370345 RepID=A0ABD0JM74_9CAEN